MYAHTAFTIEGVFIFDLPVMAVKAALSVRTLKRPLPAAFAFAAFFFPAATEALLLCWPFARLPPTKRTFFFFAFLRFFFFFFFLAFFFFAFFAFLAGFFFADFFFFAAVCCVRATVDFWICFVTSATTIASSGSMSAERNKRGCERA